MSSTLISSCKNASLAAAALVLVLSAVSPAAASSSLQTRSAGGAHVYALGQAFQESSLAGLLEKDIARAKALGRNVVDLDEGASPLRAAFVSLAADTQDNSFQTDILINNGYSSYYVTLDVGTPAQSNTKVLVDTGSSITWVNATFPGYMPSESSTAVDTGLGINQTYGIGSFDGDAYRDTVTFRGEQGPLSANGQLIGRATSQDTFDGLDGILGLGPASQASRALYNKATGEHITRQIATVTDTLFLEEKIGENVVSIGFRPIQSSDQLGTDGGFPIAKAAGTLTFGGANLDETAGPIEYVSKSQAPEVANYWGLQVDSVRFETLDGNIVTEVPLQSTPAQGIVDTASTFFALPQAVYDAYRASLPGSRISSDFLLLPPSQVERLGNMTFTIGGNDFVFTPSAQLFPRDVQEKLTGTTPESLGAYISVFSSFGVGSGQEYTFGMYWLERFYTVLDTTAQRIGFAYTDYTFQRTTELAAFRRTRRAHREHTKRNNWSGGKARLAQLGSRSPFAAGIRS